MTTEEILEDYFFKSADKWEHLKALDKMFNSWYTGVTYDYIIEYVFNGEVDIDELNVALFQLLLDKRIGLMYCSDISSITFTRRYKESWLNISEDYKFKVSYVYKTSKQYKTDLQLEKAKELLTSFIKLQNKSEMSLSQEEILEVTN